MPHSVFVHLVLPVLLAGYAERASWSALWLARVGANLRAVPDLASTLRGRSVYQFLREAHEWEPSEQTRRAVLGAAIRWFDYCQHEWPSGILYSSDGASLSQCDDLLREVAFARSLDTLLEHDRFLSDFERKVLEYRNRLQGIGGE